MDQIAKDALEASIEVWEEKLTQGPWDRQFGTLACPLCRVYYNRYLHCEGCPIMEFTGVGGCEKTPYHNATQANHRARSAGTKESYAAAATAIQAEIDFLKSLREDVE